MIHEYCSFMWEWRGTAAPFFSRSWEMVAFSPEIIWRESLSFSCSISMVFQDDFSRVLKGASSSWPSCASIVPRKSAPRQPRHTRNLSAQKQARRITSDKRRTAGNRQKARFADGSGAEHCGDGAPSFSRVGRCLGKLGIVGRGPGLDAVDVARVGRNDSGSRLDRLLASARMVFGETIENEFNGVSPCRRPACCFFD